MTPLCRPQQGLIPVKICVVPSEKYGDRYACVKVEISQQKPVRYELGMMGTENLDEELEEDSFLGLAWMQEWDVLRM